MKKFNRNIRHCGLLLSIVACGLSFNSTYLPAQQQVASASVHAISIKLVPQPRELNGEDSVPLSNGIRIVSGSSDAADIFPGKDLSDTLKARAIDMAETDSTRHETTIELLRLDSSKSRRLLDDSKAAFDEPMKAEGYVILPTHDGLAVIGATAEGLFYGAQTVKQLV